MAKFRQKLKNNLVYCFIRFIIFIFNLLPRNLCLFLGSILAYLSYRLFEKERIKSDKHLQIAFGDKLSAGERDIIIRKMFFNIFWNFIDVVRMPKYYKSQIRPLIDVEGMEHFEKVYNRGKGVIGVTGHIGNFELLAAYSAGEGYKSSAIGRELYDKRLNKLLVNNRKTMGVINIDTNESPRKIMKLLKDGYALGVLIDTDSHRVRSEMIPAFGKLSNTPVGQSIIGLRTGAGFVPMACVRNGKRYKMIIKPEVTINRTDNFETDVYNITKKCTDVLEEIVMEHKDQWIWMHNRWHTKPREKKNEDNI